MAETQIKKESHNTSDKTQGIPYDVYLKELKERLERLENKTDELTTRLTALGERLVDILETLAKQPGVQGAEREKIREGGVSFSKRLQKPPESNIEILADQIESKLEEKLEKKVEKKVEEGLVKSEGLFKRTEPEKLPAQEVERMADKLQEEETIPSPPPKKKPGILAVLNDLLIGEDEEE